MYCDVGRSPLQVFVRRLTAFGAELTSEDPHTRRAFLRACERDLVDVVETFLLAGPYVRRVDMHARDESRPEPRQRPRTVERHVLTPRDLHSTSHRDLASVLAVVHGRLPRPRRQLADVPVSVVHSLSGRAPDEGVGRGPGRVCRARRVDHVQIRRDGGGILVHVLLHLSSPWSTCSWFGKSERGMERDITGTTGGGRRGPVESPAVATRTPDARWRWGEEAPTRSSMS